MKSLKIHLVYYGSFSGTNNAIAKELSRRGMLCATTDTETLPGANRFINNLLVRFSKLYYSKSHFDFKGRWHRLMRSRSVKKVIRQSEALNILHILALHLPFNDLDLNRKHFLYLDSTWNSWSKYSTDLQHYPTRLSTDIERCERKSMHMMSHIFTTSNYLKDNIVKHYGISPKLVTVVGTGRGGIVPYFGKKDYTNKIILFVAKVRFADKGRQLVLDAFHLAHSRDPSLKLIVAGDDVFHNNPPLIPGLQTYGYTSLSQLQKLFEQASIFVMPAVNEPWGLVYLEALSCRLPIVGLNRNSIPEFIQDNRHGFAVEDSDIEGLANTFAKAFGDPARLEKMGSDGQLFAIGKFTWENTVNQITTTIYNSRTQNA